jgi:hypothetical protein
LQEGQAYTIIPELLSNTGPFEVLSYEINVGQGFTPITLGIPYTFTAGASSTMDLELRANLRTGETLISRSRFKVTPTINAIVPVGYCEEEQFEISLNDQPPIYDGEDDRLFVRTSCCDDIIRRPLLIINGFETPFIPDGADFNRDNDFDDILDKLDADVITGNTMIQEFLNDGYDLIFLDFNNEVAPLEHNTEIVKEAIRKLNTIKQTIPITKWIGHKKRYHLLS